MAAPNDKYIEKIEKTVHVLKEQLNSVRAGRANSALLDQIVVDYYGVPTPLKNLANISVPDPRTILITPFDKNVVKSIEKAIQISSIGINPNSDGKVIRLVIPPVTEETRKEKTKEIKKIGEEAKVAMRNLRRDSNDEIKKLEKDGEFTEDDEKSELDLIQKTTEKYTKEIDKIVSEKEKELMEI